MEVAMKIEGRFILFLAAVISILAVACLAGCSSVTVDGQKLKYPDEITLFRLGLYSPDCEIRTGTEIEKVYSFFDGAEFALSDDTLTEADGNINFKEIVWIYFGEDCYCIAVAENGRAECTFGDNHYITEDGAVDYAGLKAFVDKKIREYLERVLG